MHCDMVDFQATTHELALLEDFDDIGFGELYQVEFIDSTRTTIRVDRKIRDALLAIRAAKKVSRVIIHESRPTLIEYRTTATSTGLKCLKKMKF